MMPCAATWTQLEIFIPSEVRRKDKYPMITYVCNLKYGTSVVMSNTEAYSETQRTDLRSAGLGVRRRAVDGSLGLAEADCYT